MEVNFKTRVANFWEWYFGVAQRFYETIEAGNCADLVSEVTEVTQKWFPGFVWVFGPGPHDAGGHSFTLSGNGVLNMQFLAEYWLRQAPKLEGWTFHSSRQPGNISEEMGIEINDLGFSFGDTRCSVTVDEEAEAVDVVMHNARFSEADEDLSINVAFILLDETLGEFGTSTWIGNISADSEPADEMIPLLKLRDYLHDLELKKGWKKGSPTDSYVTYRIDPIDADYPRSDILFGSTSNFQVVREHLESDGDLEDPLFETGADMVYVEFDVGVLPEGDEVDFRSNIADAIHESLESEGTGQLLGGAMGSRNAYIDLLLFDTERGLELIKTELGNRELPEGTGVHFFAKEKLNRSFLV